jgi:nucleoside-diphosphate-sugar epimerase
MSKLNIPRGEAIQRVYKIIKPYMKNILITGASGFIGNFLVEEGIRRNYNIYISVRKTSTIDHLNDKDIKVIEMDLSNSEDLLRKFETLPRFNFIIHNAGITKSLDKNEYYRVNCDYTKNLIIALKQINKIPDKFVLMSSLAAYGPGNLLKPEPITLDVIPNPVTNYGRSKLEAEKFVISHKDFPYLIIRPTSVYGPREKDIYQMIKMINNHIEFYIGSHKQFLSFIYVKDLTKIIYELTESSLINKTYFLSDGNVYDKYTFGKITAKLLNKRVLKIAMPLPLVKVIAYVTEKLMKLTKGKAPALNINKVNELKAVNWNCDISPLINDLNPKPSFTSLEEGLKETLSWYKQNHWL